MKVAVLGYGVVGSGVVKVLRENQELIAKRAGEVIEVARVLDLREFPGSDIESILTHNYDDILNDEEIEVVVEVMGGVEPANTFSKKAMERGKHVVTSNKAVVAACGSSLLALAREKKVNYLFEASVAGGIPIIRTLGSCLTADEILKIHGIINGTTNYMLTEMMENGAEYADVLKEAQGKGYAEADPTADVAGYDACRKIAILTSIISGKFVDYNDVHTEGIVEITAADMLYAKKMGRTVKLLAQCEKYKDTYKVCVAPKMIGPSHPLYTVNGVFNAVFVEGNMLGDSMYYGSGAGSLPTASAVASDVVAATMNRGRDIMNFWSEEKLEIAPHEETTCKFFVRMSGSADSQAEEIAMAFGQVEVVDAGIEGEFGFVTKEMTEAAYADVAAGFENLIGRIRVE